MNKAFLVAYQCLDNIYRNGAYCEIELDRQLKSAPTVQKSLVTKLVYGVLDNCLKIDYIISQFAKSVKPSVKGYLRIGIYCLLELSLPSYAVVNDCVELAKTSGKVHTVGFVNATLRAVSRALTNNEIKYPKDKIAYLSIFYSFPAHLTKKFVAQYGYEMTKNILSYKFDKGAHIRINTVSTSKEELTALLYDKGVDFSLSPLPNCLYVRGSLVNIPSRMYTNMSLGSCLVARAIKCPENAKILDLCSAPGGKSVYLAQLYPNCQITSCDIHQHRLDLVISYAKRMGVQLKTVLWDATTTNEQFVDGFDCVLCDVPCSNSGVFYSKPDIRLKTAQAEDSQLVATQRQILSTAANYVKKNGTIIYSTCSLLAEENEQVVEDFLKSHNDFEGQSLQGGIYGDDFKKGFLPPVDHVEGFFVALLKRK